MDAENIELENHKPLSLRKNVGIPGGVLFLVGTIIGLGIFATPKWVLMYSGSVGLNLVIWASCGVISMLGALCYVELGLAIPKSGAEYAYLMEAFGPLPAFLYSWIYVIFVKPTGVMILLVFGSYVLEPFFPGCSNRDDLAPLIKLLAAAALGTYARRVLNTPSDFPNLTGLLLELLASRLTGTY